MVEHSCVSVFVHKSVVCTYQDIFLFIMTERLMRIIMFCLFIVTERLMSIKMFIVTGMLMCINVCLF